MTEIQTQSQDQNHTYCGTCQKLINNSWWDNHLKTKVHLKKINTPALTPTPEPTPTPINNEVDFNFSNRQNIVLDDVFQNGTSLKYTKYGVYKRVDIRGFLPILKKINDIKKNPLNIILGYRLYIKKYKPIILMI